MASNESYKLNVEVALENSGIMRELESLGREFSSLGDKVSKVTRGIKSDFNADMQGLDVNIDSDGLRKFEDEVSASTSRVKSEFNQDMNGLDVKVDTNGLRGFEQDFDKTTDRVESEFNQTLGRLSTGLQGFGSGMKNIGTRMSVGITAPLALAGRSMLSAGEEYSKQYGRVKAVGELDDAEAEELSNIAKVIGAGTQFSSTESLAGAEELLLLGFDGDETGDALEGVMDLATISSGNVSLSASTIGSIMNMYEKPAKDAVKISDVIAKGTAVTALGTEDLGYAMSYAGGEAHDFGISLEDTVAMLGVLADNGVDGSKGGTMLRGSLQKLTNPTKKSATAMEELGVSVYDADGNARNFLDIIGDLDKAMSGFDQETRDSYLGDLFDRTNVGGVRTLMDNLSRVSEVSKELQNSSGYGKVMGEDMMSTPAGRMEAARGAIENANIEMFTALAPLIVELADGIRDIADAFSALPEPVQLAIGKGLILVGILGPILHITGTVIEDAGKILDLFKKIGESEGLKKLASMQVGGTTLGGMVQILAVVLAVLVAGYLVFKNWDNITGAIEKSGEWMSNLGDKIKEKVQPAIDGAKDKWSEFRDEVDKKAPQFNTMFDGFEDSFSGVTDVVKGLWDTLAGLAKFIGSTLLQGLYLVGWAVEGLFTGNWDTEKLKEQLGGSTGEWGIGGLKQAGGGLMSMLGLGIGDDGSLDVEGGIAGIFKGINTALIGGLTGLWTTFTDWTNAKWSELIVWVATKMSELWTPIATWWTNLIAGITTWLTNILTTTNDWWAGLIVGLATWLSDMWTAVSTWWTNLITGIGTWLSGIWTSITTWWSNMLTGFIAWIESIRTKFSEFKENVTMIITQFKDAISTKFSELKETVSSKVEEIKNTISTKFNEAVDSAVQWVSELPGKIRAFFTDVMSAGRYLVDGFVQGLQSGWENVTSAATSLANKAIQAVQSTLDEHSPSKVSHKQGAFFGEGLANGIREMYGSVGNASVGLANVAIDSMNGGMSDFGSNISGMVTHAVGATVAVDDAPETKQPLIIHATLGNEDYEIFVDDITRQQDKKVWMNRR